MVCQVTAYFPAGVWYSLWDNSHVNAGRHGCSRTLTATLGDVPLHVRGGAIVPMQQPAMVTDAVRSSPLTLFVALAPEVILNRIDALSWYVSDTGRGTNVTQCVTAHLLCVIALAELTGC